MIEELKAEARHRGLWNLFHPELSGLSNLEYAAVAEISGWSPVHRARGDQLPGAGHRQHGDAHAVRHAGAEGAWLEPLLDGQIRSAFAMTEPDVASLRRHATSTRRIVRDGDDYVINGRKWWITGAADERCQIFIVMGKTDPDADPHRQQSMVLVPRDTPGVTIVRHLPIFGYQDQHGHSEIVFDDVRVPATNLLAGEGDGFMIAQARLGPGRIHHAMRAIGMAERALALMVDRAKYPGRVRPAAGRAGRRARPDRQLADRDRPGPAARLQDRLADRPARRQGRAHRDRGDQGRRTGGGHAPSSTGRSRCSAAPASATTLPLAYFYAWARVLRIVDGPDAVHRRTVAREELARPRPDLSPAP